MMKELPRKGDNSIAPFGVRVPLGISMCPLIPLKSYLMRQIL
jgi:hypothetical protein